MFMICVKRNLIKLRELTFNLFNLCYFTTHLPNVPKLYPEYKYLLVGIYKIKTSTLNSI